MQYCVGDEWVSDLWFDNAKLAMTQLYHEGNQVTFWCDNDDICFY